MPLSLKNPDGVIGFLDEFAAVWDGGILAFSGMLPSLIGLHLLPKSQGTACPDQFIIADVLRDTVMQGRALTTQLRPPLTPRVVTINIENMNKSHHLRGSLPSQSPNLFTPINKQRTICKMSLVWQLLNENGRPWCLLNEGRTWCLAREPCCSHVMPKAMCWDCEWVRMWTLTRSQIPGGVKP